MSEQPPELQPAHKRPNEDTECVTDIDTDADAEPATKQPRLVGTSTAREALGVDWHVARSGAGSGATDGEVRGEDAGEDTACTAVSDPAHSHDVALVEYRAASRAKILRIATEQTRQIVPGAAVAEGRIVPTAVQKVRKSGGSGRNAYGHDSAAREYAPVPDELLEAVKSVGAPLRSKSGGQSGFVYEQRCAQDLMSALAKLDNECNSEWVAHLKDNAHEAIQPVEDEWFKQDSCEERAENHLHGQGLDKYVSNGQVQRVRKVCTLMAEAEFTHARLVKELKGTVGSREALEAAQRARAARVDAESEVRRVAEAYAQSLAPGLLNEITTAAATLTRAREAETAAYERERETTRPQEETIRQNLEFAKWVVLWILNPKSLRAHGSSRDMSAPDAIFRDLGNVQLHPCHVTMERCVHALVYLSNSRREFLAFRAAMMPISCVERMCALQSPDMRKRVLATYSADELRAALHGKEQ